MTSTSSRARRRSREKTGTPASRSAATKASASKGSSVVAAVANPAPSGTGAGRAAGVRDHRVVLREPEQRPLHRHRPQLGVVDLVDRAERPELRVGDDVVRMEIVRAADRLPISVATTWLAADRFPEAARIFRRHRSITRTLEHYGVTNYRRKWTRVSAAFADAVDAGRLRLSVHRPILVVESVDVAVGGDEPILTTRGRFSADRVALTIES